ncbi:MAG: hypothetical protein AAF078_04750 [Planctomycetota bacterium]
MTHARTSSAVDALLICGVSFAMSCLAFVVAVVGLIPAFGTAAAWWGVADAAVAAGVLALLVGPPVVGALWGLTIASRLIKA